MPLLSKWKRLDGGRAFEQPFALPEFKLCADIPSSSWQSISGELLPCFHLLAELNLGPKPNCGMTDPRGR